MTANVLWNRKAGGSKLVLFGLTSAEKRMAVQPRGVGCSWPLGEFRRDLQFPEPTIDVDTVRSSLKP